jgi:hypothetical protein
MVISKWRIYHLLFREYLLQRIQPGDERAGAGVAAIVFGQKSIWLLLHTAGCSRVTRIECRRRMTMCIRNIMSRRRGEHFRVE